MHRVDGDVAAEAVAHERGEVVGDRLGCERTEHGIGAYGGGQFELGPGRGHIQYLASIFHPGTPNDVAPTGYNSTDVEPGLPSSPLPPEPSAIGFRWGEA